MKLKATISVTVDSKERLSELLSDFAHSCRRNLDDEVIVEFEESDIVEE